MKSINILAIMVTFLFSNCATTRCVKDGHLFPSGHELSAAFKNAGTHPGTWIPLLGATAVAVGGWDRDISEWAVQEEPIFGSYNGKQDPGDILSLSAHIGMLATSLAVQDNDTLWLCSLTRRLIWEHLGVIAAARLVDPVRRYTDRDRPHGGKRSFPCWHATKTAAYVGMANRNIQATNFSPFYKYSTQFILTSIALGSGWARIEANEHYPTDALFGMALGNFVAILIHDAFLIDNNNNDLTLIIDGHGRISIGFVMAF